MARQTEEGMTISACVIAGASSGAGKTTVSVGLMAALKRRGLTVQPFKAGPDYIDPSHHAAVCARPSYNLDTWMMGNKGVKRVFQRAISGADAAVVEGVMGLFDGKDGRAGEGSTAHLAKVLNLGVILVVDARSMAGSAAALVYGFERFDREVNLIGVIFNRVGSERHFRMLKEAVEGRCGAKVLGYLPKDEDVTMPERHLGLMMPSQSSGEAPGVERLADLAEKYLDIKGILEMSRVKATGILSRRDSVSFAAVIGKPHMVRIAVALDDAFCFYYRENLDILEELGAEIAFFSPLSDRGLPADTDGVYLGGGYPELHAPVLEANKSLRRELRDFARSGRPVYAECGGLMYLGRGIVDAGGRRFRMAGLFPWTSRMLSRRRSLGYREVTAGEGCPFLEAGQRIRGHEFHYSEMTPSPGTARAYMIKGGDGSKEPEGYVYRNTLASYVHLHFASNPEFAGGFVRMCGMTAAGGRGRINDKEAFCEEH